jgi:hypothetical protein
MSDLVLHVKREYFEAIRDGTKKFEYRQVTPYWTRRIEGREFDLIIICLGYPARHETERRIVFPWRGYEKLEITHEQFGGKAHVYAIRLTPHPADAKWEDLWQ